MTDCEALSVKKIVDEEDNFDGKEDVDGIYVDGEEDVGGK